MTWFRTLIQKLQKDERGATMVEYLIIIAVVGVAAIGVWSVFGDAIQSKLGEQTDQVDALPGG